MYHMSKMLRDIQTFLFALEKVRASSTTGTTDQENINMAFYVHVEKNVYTMNYTYRKYEPNKWPICRAWILIKVNPKFEGHPRRTSPATVATRNENSASPST